MSSGKHRRPEPDPLPEVDLAERLRSGPVVRAGSEPVVPGARTADPVPGAAAGAAAAAPGPTVVVRRDRHAERLARRRTRRRRVLVVTAGVLGVLLVAVGIWLLVRPSGTETPTTTTAADKQAITLVQVTGADGTAAGSAIVGSTRTRFTSSCIAITCSHVTTGFRSSNG